MDGVSAFGTIRFAAIYDFSLVSEEHDPDRSVVGKNLYRIWYHAFSTVCRGDTPVSLTESQRKLLTRWARLREEQQNVIFALIDKM